MQKVAGLVQISYLLFFLVFSVPVFSQGKGTQNPDINSELRKPEWRYSAGGGVLGNIVQGPGGDIYLVSESRALHSIDPETGKRLWLFRPGATKLKPFVVASPDGTIYFFNEDNTLYAINSGARVRWRLKVKGSIHFYPLCNTRGDILLFTGEKRVTSFSRFGKEQWNFSFKEPPLFGGLSNALGEAFFLDRGKTLYTLSEDGKLIRKIRVKEDITQMMLTPLGEIVLATSAGNILFYSGEGKLTSKVESGFKSSVTALRTGTANAIYALLYDGSVYLVERGFGEKKGNCTKIARVGGLSVGASFSEQGKFITTDVSGNIYIGEESVVVARLSSLTYPLITDKNIVITGGSNWVVAGYRGSQNYPGYTQFRGNGARNGICQGFRSVFEVERQKYKNHILYMNSKMIIDTGDLTEIESMLNEMAKSQKRGRLEKDFPCYKIILYDLLYSTMRSDNDSIDRYKYIRILTYQLIGDLDDIRFRGIVIQATRTEIDDRSFLAGMATLKRIAVDFDGAILEMLNKKIRTFSPKSDQLVLETAKTVVHILRYNGFFHGKSGFQIYKYLLNLPLSSRTKRELCSIIRDR